MQHYSPLTRQLLIVLAATSGTTLHAGDPNPPVQVIVDMDPETPQIQSTITVPACTTVVQDVAVYIMDPLGEREMWWIGYVGGIDRGISFGHMPDNTNQGLVSSLIGTALTPVNPQNTGWIVQWLDPGFLGPEVQYIESGAETSEVIPIEPDGPVFTVDIVLDGAQPGDCFDFHLLDFTAVWDSGLDEAGAFSTQGPMLTLDTGGDAVPDATNTIYGMDPDTPVPVPPGSFGVDYIDGPPSGGPATIEVIPAIGDLDADGSVGIVDLLQLLGAWGICTDCPEDLNNSGGVDIDDLLLLLARWGGC